MSFYNIVFIEGVRRIGKSSQCIFLRKHLAETIPNVGFMAIDSIHSSDEIDKKIDQMREWCQSNPKGTLVVSGSLAFSIVCSDLNKQKYGASYLEYELPIKNFLNLCREFKTKHILISSDNYQFLKEREVEGDPINLVEISMVYQGLEHFEKSQMSDFRWEKLNVRPHQPILEINRNLIKLIN